MLLIKRRSFLQASAAAGAMLWLPGRAHGDVRGAVRRAVVLYLPGGVRWEASFAAAESALHNPYGRLPWSAVPKTLRAHQWTAGRPWPMSSVFHRRWLGREDAERLHVEDATDCCFAQPRLARWPGEPVLPSFVSLAPQLSVLACDAEPNQPTQPEHLEHLPAQRRICTGSPTGDRGLATLATVALRGRTRLPPTVVDAPGFALGATDASQPLCWYSLLGPPTDALAALGIDDAQAAVAGLAVDTAPPQTAYGTTTEGAPLTHAMLRQLFGTTDEDRVAGDPLREILGPSAAGDDLFGWQGARAIRLLQHGAPLVFLAAGDFDTHSDERSLGAAQLVRVARLLSGLSFALHSVADPDTGAPLWDSTLVLLVSEFGRRGPNLLPDGFNPTGGSDHAREQYIPMMGGPLRLPGQRLDDGGRPYQTNRVWTSLFSAMGVPLDVADQGLHRRYAPEIPGLLSMA